MTDSTSSFWYWLCSRATSDKGVYILCHEPFEALLICMCRGEENREDCWVQMYCLENHTTGCLREMWHSEARTTQAELIHLHLCPVSSISCHLSSSLLSSPTNMPKNTERDRDIKTTSSVHAPTLLQERKRTTYQPDEGAIWGMWTVTMATKEWDKKIKA